MQIQKYHPSGTLAFEYSGELLAETATLRVITAIFQGDDKELGYTVFAKGDIFTEYFYAAQRFNILRVESMQTGMLKGWYCNISNPAEFYDDSIRWTDLYLDIWVAPSGAILLLDEDELATAQDLDAAGKEAARRGAQTAQEWIHARKGPFLELNGMKSQFFLTE